MATAARSSRLGKRSRLQPSSPRANKHQKRRRCASRARHRETDVDAWRQRLRHARVARPPTDRRGRASRSVQSTKHRRPERYRVQDKRPHRKTQQGRSAEAINARRDVQPLEWRRTNQRISQGLRPRANARPRPRPCTSAGVHRVVSAPRRCNHQLRTRRQSGKYRDHGVRTLL